MLVIMQGNATPAQIAHVRAELATTAVAVDVSVGRYRTVMGRLGEEAEFDPDHIRALAGVDEVVPVLAPYRRVMSLDQGHRTPVRIGDVVIGGEEFVVIGGPCAVETREQAMEACRRAKAAGARVLRGEAMKPRKSPHVFEGIGVQGWRIMREIADELGLPFVAEVLEIGEIDVAGQYADALRVGAGLMYHTRLLNALGGQPLPVILKRAPGATHEEWFLAAERIAHAGNPKVILCGRGIRTFEDHLRFTPDIASIGVAHDCTRLPVIYDPSHSSGKRALVARLCRAALGMGADGLIVDVHPDPEAALIDGPQALPPAEFDDVMLGLRDAAPAFGRKM